MATLFESFITLLEGKLEYIAQHQGAKIEAALKNDAHAKQTMSATDVLHQLEQMDPSKKKAHLQWLANMYIKGSFRLEDAHRVHAALQGFEQHQAKLKSTANYKSLADLEDAVEQLGDVAPETSKRQQIKQVKANEAETMLETSKYLVVHPKTEAAAKFYGKGTKWCTAADEHNMFNHYNDRGPIYIIINKSTHEKWQVHDDTMQFMDVKDGRIDHKDLQTMLTDQHLANWLWLNAPTAIASLGESPPPSVIPELITNARFATEYAIEYLGDRWPAAEPYIAKNPECAAKYAYDVMNERWYDAEPYIAKNASAAMQYMKHFFNEGQRWRDAEPAILQNGLYAVTYAKLYIRDRWPEAEPAILHAEDKMDIVEYARDVIHGRWPEAEPILVKYPAAGAHYAMDVLKRRWPAIEAGLLQRETAYVAYSYASIFFANQGKRWPEAEEFLRGIPHLWKYYLSRLEDADVRQKERGA